MNHLFFVVVLQFALFAVQTANVAPGTCWAFAGQDAGALLIDGPFEAESSGVDDLDEIGPAVRLGGLFLPLVFEAIGSKFRPGEFAFLRTNYSRGPPARPLFA